MEEFDWDVEREFGGLGYGVVWKMRKEWIEYGWEEGSVGFGIVIR